MTPISKAKSPARWIGAISALAAAAILGWSSAPALGQEIVAHPGAIVGVVTNKDKLPVPNAIITAERAGGGGFHAVLSAQDGSFSLSDLAPGSWALTLHVEGSPDVTQSLVVNSSAITRYDAVMNVPEKAPPAIPSIADALQAPDAGPAVDNQTPFAFGDFTWLNGNPRNHEPAFDTKIFTPDIRVDASYIQDFNHPVDHTIVGSTEEFRSDEFQLDQISFGGNLHYDNVNARILTMFGLFSTTIPRNDSSSGNIGGVGQWDLQDAYRYVSEANAGYHWDVNHGLNVDAGIFASYIGLFSFYNYDNWTYQPSYVSSNTPWVFNGLRIQWFPTNKLKIEPWIINGWASYAKFNSHPGIGGQILYMPYDWLKLVFNNYGIGDDNLQNYPAGELVNGIPVNYAKTNRIHTDDSIEVKYYESHTNGDGISKAAFSFTADAGCQYGGGVTCWNGVNKSNFLGWMLYNRLWFHHDLFAVTLGGGSMTNPGRYLTLLQPINGATASTGTPYFSEEPGQPLYQWDATLNLQYMPKEWITFWTEYGFRHSSVPYFSGPGGVTPPGGNNGSPANYVCNTGASSGTNVLSQAESACGGGASSLWYPDLVKQEAMLSAGILVKF